MTFATLQPTTGGPIPIHPQPSIYATTIGVVDEWPDGSTTIVTPDEVEAIMARPSWDFEEADIRLTGERIAALHKEVDAAVAKRRPARKRQPRKPKATP